MQIMKFGGSSLASADRILRAGELVAERSRSCRIGVVVSALAGITDSLDECGAAAAKGESSAALVAQICDRHQREMCIIGERLPRFGLAAAAAGLAERIATLENWLDGIRKLGVCPDPVGARLLAVGEQLSAAIMAALLSAMELDVQLLDSGDYIVTRGSLLEGVPILPEIERRFGCLRKAGARILAMPGFVARDERGMPSLLGRNGSDYSAALMAYGLRAELCEIWTDTDGIFTADPGRVPQARPIEEMSYGEAMELSFFGAQVLHPKTLLPVALLGIPTLIRNSMNPGAPGTRVHRDAASNNGALRGLSCLEHVAVINLGGSGMQGVPGMAARLFSCVARRGISVILITQASSEYSIGFCVPDSLAAGALEAIREEFELEIQAGLINPPDIRARQAIISPVGDGVRERKGVAGRLFSALASADINVVAISQGSSERAISAVVDGAGATRALRVAHQFFFNTTRSIDLVIMGVGAVGSELLDQLARQRASLLGQDIELRVIGVANSSRLLLDESAIQLDNWRERLAASPKPSTLSEVRDFIRQVKPLNPVLVDCTSSDEIAGSYVDFFCAGLHVVTANKKANSAGLSYYRALRRTANANGRRFLYEATVGAGLPVIDTLQGLIASGDRLEAFSGILSGSLSFLFGLLEEGVEFSAAVRIARERRFTEPDPREDLSGLDVARKLLILMREAGGEQELPGIRIDPILPADFDCTGRTEDFLLRARQLDGHFARRIDRLKAEGKALRFAAEMRGGRGRVGLVEVDRSHPLCSIRGGENTLVFHTTRYAPMPLVIRGYGAGAQVTAAGVFADIMRVKFRGQAP